MLRLIRGARAARNERQEDVAAASDDLAPLARAVAAGDTKAVHTLVTAIGPSLLKVVRGILGARHPDFDDVMQEAAMAAVAALRRFEGRSSVLHFCCRVATFTTISACRRLAARPDRNAVPIHELTDEDFLATDGPGPAAALMAARRRRILRMLLARLPEPQAEALVQYVVLGWSVEEIGQAAGVPSNTVRSRLRLAKDALRRQLSTAGFEDLMTVDKDDQR